MPLLWGVLLVSTLYISTPISKIHSGAISRCAVLTSKWRVEMLWIHQNVPKGCRFHVLSNVFRHVLKKTILWCHSGKISNNINTSSVCLLDAWGSRGYFSNTNKTTCNWYISWILTSVPCSALHTDFLKSSDNFWLTGK